MPEVGGRVDFGAEDHEQTMMALGLQSKREITRTRIRVRTAMAAQTRDRAGTHRAAGRPMDTGSPTPAPSEQGPCRLGWSFAHWISLGEPAGPADVDAEEV